MPSRLLCSILLSLMLCVGSAYAQTKYSVTGTVTDSISVPLAGASIRLISKSDTLKTATNDQGQFTFNNIQWTAFRLKVSYIGYFDLLKDIDASQHGDKVTLPNLILKIDTNSLNEVIIKDRVRPVVLKKDTVEYNLAAFRGNDSEMISELLKRLPGLRIDADGNMSMNGKPVTKLRVNGRDFFTGNIKEFIGQLPAGLFTKAQIINDYGRTAEFTGVKKDFTQTLNLVTQPGMDNGIFGPLSAGGGTNNQRSAGVNANYWKSARQIGLNSGLLTSKNSVGNNNNKTLNFSLGDNIGKSLTLNSNYHLFDNSIGSESNSFSETVNSLGKINNEVSSTNDVNNNNQALSANLSYTPKKFYLNMDISAGFSKSANESSSNSQQTGVVQQGLINESINTAKNPTMGVNLTIGRVINEKNRLTGSFSYNHSNSTSEAKINQNIRYYDTLGVLKKDSVFNSLVSNDGSTQNLGFNITYSATITPKSNLDVVYNFSQTLQHTLLETRQINPLYGLSRIDSLSSDNHNDLNNNQLNLSYRQEMSKMNLNIGMSIQRNGQSGSYEGRTEKVNIATYNFAPTINLDYTPSDKNQLSFNYSAFAQPPSIEQLRPIRDNRNLQNIIIGNPNLKTGINHNIEGNFRNVNAKNDHTFSVGFSASMFQNQITSNTVIVKDTLNSLKQITTFVNASGSNTIGLKYYYAVPFKINETISKVEYNGDINFNRQLIYTDNVRSFNNSRHIQQAIRTSISLKKVSGNAEVNYSQTTNSFAIGQGLNNKVSDFSFRISGQVNITERSSFSVNLSKSFIKGYTNVGSNNPFIVNASATHRFFKNKLNVDLSASDIFNQTNRFNQWAYGNSVVYSKTNYVTRFFVLSCHYNLSKFGSGLR